MTYDELKESVYSYLENRSTEIIAEIAKIVIQGESRIYNAVRTPDQRFVGGATATSASPTITAPANFIEPLALYLRGANTGTGETRTALLQKSTSFINEAYGTVRGVPKFYALQSTAVNYNAPFFVLPAYGEAIILLGPNADTNYSLWIEYIGIPPSITDAPLSGYPSTSTWLSISFPETLLYACLLEGYIYMKGDKDLLATFQARYDAAMIDLRRSCEGLQLQDEYRNPQVGKEISA